MIYKQKKKTTDELIQLFEDGLRKDILNRFPVNEKNSIEEYETILKCISDKRYHILEDALHAPIKPNKFIDNLMSDLNLDVTFKSIITLSLFQNIYKLKLFIENYKTKRSLYTLYVQWYHQYLDSTNPQYYMDL